MKIYECLFICNVPVARLQSNKMYHIDIFVKRDIQRIYLQLYKATKPKKTKNDKNKIFLLLIWTNNSK